MRVVIAEDLALLRDGLIRLLRDTGFEVAAAVDHPDRFLEAVEEHRPDVCVVDVRLPPTFNDEGVRAALEARRRIPGLPILILSQYVEHTCSRTASPTSPTSSPRSSGWRRAARRWTRRRSRNCSSRPARTTRSCR